MKCAALCSHCATSCLEESDPKMMVKCVQLDMECAAICYAAVQLMSLGSKKAAELCKLCADICESCAKECSKYDNEHCKECAKVCSECAIQCRSMQS